MTIVIKPVTDYKIVGNFDTDNGPPRYGCYDSDTYGTQGQGEIICQIDDLVDFYPWCGFIFKGRDNGSGGHCRDVSVDPEIFQPFFQQLGFGFQLCRINRIGSFFRIIQNVNGGQLKSGPVPAVLCKYRWSGR